MQNKEDITDEEMTVGYYYSVALKEIREHTIRIVLEAFLAGAVSMSLWLHFKKMITLNNPSFNIFMGICWFLIAIIELVSLYIKVQTIGNMAVNYLIETRKSKINDEIKEEDNDGEI